MRKLVKSINKNDRIIEFNPRESLIVNYLNNRDKFLAISKLANIQNDYTKSLNSEDFKTTIVKNSTDVIILNSSNWKEIKALQVTSYARKIFERITFSNLPIIIYFLFKGIISGRQKYQGLFFHKKGIRFFLYAGIKRRRISKQYARHYLTPLVKLEEFFNELNKENVKYCILRWFEKLPHIEHGEDIDLLVEDDDLKKVYSLMDEKPGIVAFDIYSKSGIPGSDFKHLPYYVYFLANEVLNNTVLYKNTFKVPTWKNYFYLLAYHAVFHKGEQSGLKSLKYNLNIKKQPDHDYLFHLKNILEKTDLFVKDFSLEGLHKFLEETDYAPPLDTQYKLSLHNNYLNAYLEEFHNQNNSFSKYRGLVCFVAREKIIQAGLLEDLKKFIKKEGFTILKIVKIEEPYRDKFVKKVRGGNWNQGPWPSNGGLPEVLIVAVDVYPINPDPEDHLKHPGLTNKRIENKNEIRNFINERFDNKHDYCNGIHSSDNEIQAIEYLNLAGLREEDFLEEINRMRKAFETKFPVIQVLSEYSKRAKVELIKYNGGKAVLKTFKPNCEKYIENEVEAYTAFKDLKEIPDLLEVGENYLITSYIEGAEFIGYRISISLLKKCLKLLKKIYDKGYSVLDFKPKNFLIDKRKNIYLIDFEFLHKYENKPPFLECYDLVGIPETIDPLYVPNNHIPEDKVQFDALWGRFTGIHYEDLIKLNSYRTNIKSNFRFLKKKFKKLFSLVKKESERSIKRIYRIIP